jgi:hypothetical protein
MLGKIVVAFIVRMTYYNTIVRRTERDMIMTKTNEDILNQEWILSKWDLELNKLCDYEVRINDIIDGPLGYEWVVGQGWALAEFKMPLEHFRKQAQPIEEGPIWNRFMDEPMGPIVPMVGPTRPEEKEAVRAFMDELVS